MQTNSTKHILRSLLAPALLSLTGFAVTMRWHAQFDAPLRDSAGGVAVATLAEGRDGVEKRPKRRLIWQEIPPGAELYRGDAVRTAPNAEGRVRLADGTVIAMEPNSLIILEETKGGLELNLVSGSLFVAKEAAPDRATTKTDKRALVTSIKAGATHLVLGATSTQLSLSKLEGAAATVAVAKGDVAVKAGEKQFTVKEGTAGTVDAQGLDVSSTIETTSPPPNAILAVTEGKASRVAFRWQPLSKEHLVHLELGTTREALRPATAEVAGDVGGLTFAVPDGIFYWQLKARLKNQPNKAAASVVLRAETVQLTPPELVSPAVGTTLFLEKETTEVELSWRRSPKAMSSRVQLAPESSFAKPILDKELQSSSELAVVLKREGRFYWRVLDEWEGREKPLVSAVRSFDVKKIRELAVPALVAPAQGAALTRLDEKPTFLEWQEVPGAEAYDVRVVGGDKPSLERRLDDTHLRLPTLAPGTYEWQVRASAGADSSSKWSSARKFSVNKVEKIAWTTNGEYTYRTQTPEIELRWKAGSPNVKSYRLRYARESDELAKAPWKKTSTNTAAVRHEEDGSYYYEVQGLGDQGQVVAVGEPRRVRLQPEKPLSPPELIAKSGILSAAANGTLSLRWRPVEHAASYVIELRSPESSGSRTFKSKGTEYRLSALMPGKYTIRLATVNARGEVGPSAPPRTIVVPDTSDLPPPSVQNLRVH